MASILYRKGNTHIVDGVQCEMLRVEAWEVDGLLNSGCVANVGDLDKPSEKDDLPESKDELASIALEFGVTLDKRKTVESLQVQVRGLLDGDQS